MSITDKICVINTLIAENCDRRYLHSWFQLALWKVRGGAIFTYFCYDLDKLNRYERNKFWTSRFQQKYEKKWNNAKEKSILLCKEEFNKHFGDIIGRDWIYPHESTFSEFASFVQKHPKFMQKANWLCEGEGIKKYQIGDIGNKSELMDLYSKYKEEFVLCEEILTQNKMMSSLNESSVNTIRISTFNNGGNILVLAAALRCGRKGVHTDNLHGGGICASIDIETGIVKSLGYDKDCKRYKKHPDSGVCFIGFKVPHWEKVIDSAKKAHLTIPELKWIGWDIAITEKGVAYIEGNTNQGEDLIQIGAEGLHSVFKKNGLKE